MNFNYQKELVRIWENAVKLYRNGNTSADTFPIQHDLPFLNKIGLNKMDIFDYVEDWVCEGTPDLGTFLLIHDLRRDFFIEEHSGRILNNEVNTIPGFTNISMFSKMCEVGGLPYDKLLDRLIELAIEQHENRMSLKFSRD